DGTTTANLTSANFSVSGLVGTESITVASTTGTYNSKDVATATTITATLTAASYTAGAGTSLANYTPLPTSATGPGTITSKTLTVSIIGNPTKTYDGTTAATLTSANFSVSGLVGTDSFTVNQTAGTYNARETFSASTVTASLTAANYTAGAGTLTSNYTPLP